MFKSSKPLSLLSTVLVTAVLTGCNTMPKENAGDAFKYAMDKSFFEANSYNFSIEQSFQISPAENTKKVAIEDAGFKALSSDSVGSETALAAKTMDQCDADFDAALKNSENSSSMESAEKVYLACLQAASESKGSGEGFSSDKGSLASFKEKMTPERIRAINQYWLKPMSFKVDGAVDAKRHQLLMDYRFTYAPKNFNFSINFPLFFDFKELSLAVDPSLLLPVLAPTFAEDVGTKWEGKWVKFTLPEEYKKDVPASLILRAFNTAMQKSYGGMSNQNFTFLPSDTNSKKLGATQTIEMTLSAKDQVMLFDRLISHWITAVEDEIKANPTEIAKPKQFNEFLGMAKDMTKDGFLTEMVGNNSEVLSLLGDANYKMYTSDSGKVLGAFSDQRITALADMINADINTKSFITISNHNRAKFNFRPNSNNIIDGNELIKKLDKVDKKKPFKNPF